MPKVKTRDLDGVALDHAVAVAEGFVVDGNSHRQGTLDKGVPFVPVSFGGCEQFKPSQKWEHGGPIIEREHITLDYAPESTNGKWLAEVWPMTGEQGRWGRSDSLLVAAMRVFVHSRLGNFVDIPQEVLDVNQ